MGVTSSSKSGIVNYGRNISPKKLISKPSVSGGTYYSDATYSYRVFTANGTLTVSSASLNAEVLVVAGGGSGGAGTGGGGGAGGLINIASYPLSVGSYNITIGAGGTNDDVGVGTSGSNTVITNGINTLTALGGGAGGATETGNVTFAASSGGSGGGAQYYYPSNGNTAPGSATQPSTTSDGVNSYPNTGFGNSGSGNVSTGSGGGGGGAGSAASNGSASGGVGKQLSTSGTLSWYAAGGSGGNSGTSSTNGIGGYHIPPNGTAGVVNTGSGGGGGWDHSGGTGGAGGSGIVIVKYLNSDVVAPDIVYDGTTQAGAVSKSTDILLANPSAPSGWYWIIVNGVARQFWVDNSFDGGGWVLVATHVSGTALPGPTLAASTSGTDIIASSGFIRGTTDQRNYTTLVPLDTWKYIIDQNNAGKYFVYHTRSSAGSPGASDSRRSRWTWTGWSATHQWQGVANLTNQVGGTTPGLYSYHITNNRGWTTADADRDSFSGNCSTDYGSAPWWYDGCWDGSFWGGNGGSGYANAAFWTGSSSDYYGYGAFYVK